VKGIECAFHGRLGRSPEPRVSKAGRSFTTFSLAVATGAEEVTWVSVVAFGETAEALAGLQAGSYVYIEGSLRLDAYERKDGTSASALKVTASTAIALGQVGQRRRPAPSKKTTKRPDSQAPLRPAEHDGPNDPMPF